VGQKGVRVQAVINELGEEKIDIVPFSEDPARFIAAALSPAKDVVVTLNEEERQAKVKWPDSQLSLAIGKGGQNVRLAAKLTGWKIDIEGLGDSEEPQPEAGQPLAEKEEGTKEHEQQLGDKVSDDKKPKRKTDKAKDVEKAEKDISSDNQMKSGKSEVSESVDQDKQK
jgi:N utilization substance protein A